MIVQELYKIQHRCGYLPRNELESLAYRLTTPLYRVQEVVSFYPHFRTTPPPDVEVQVCLDMSCRLRGSAGMLQQLSETLANSQSQVTVRGVSCLGRCDRAPVACVTDHRPLPTQTDPPDDSSHPTHLLCGRTADSLRKFVTAAADQREAADFDQDIPDHSRDWQINIYARQPKRQAYAAVRDFIGNNETDEQRNPKREAILKALETANLLGMGGAGGRTLKKWGEVRSALGDRKYVVCNADESEPGTFKDRELLLRTPHLVLEGVILAGLLLNAERGYIYVRHEYEAGIQALRDEIARATKLGVCGEDLLGSGLSFPVEVFVSPGGYICGEQTALIQALQDQRAEPRNRPPELQTNGLWDMPTLLNNAETFAWVPAVVLQEDGRWFAAQGAQPEFKGRRLFSVSGDVAQPGVVEVPIGIKIGELIQQCGGMRGGQALKAIALSGPSGGFLPAKLPLAAFPAEIASRLPQGATEVDLGELELDIALFRKWKIMLGAGIVIYGDDANLVEQTVACSQFYRRETCGKCVPCRIGSTKIAEWSERLYSRQMSPAEVSELLDKQGALSELALTMRSTAICGLGTVASNPLASLLNLFPEEVAKHTQG